MATKYGTAHGETITGTSSADTIYARAGDDTLLGRAGGDRLLGEAGNDKVYGEDGNDQLTGGFGDDLLDGGAGRDRILYTGISAPDADGYGIRADLAEGYVDTSTVGRDTLRRVEDVDGSQFMDWIEGNASVNLIGGGPGDDYLFGEGGADKLYGGVGDDFLRGDDRPDDPSFDPTGGADLLYGGEGRDRLYGDPGNDILRGEAGDDFLYGLTGNDTLIGGGGEDRLRYAAGSDYPSGKDVIADFTRGEDQVVFTAEFDDRHFRDFYDLDTNRNGVLDDGDEFVDIASASHGGTSRVSTIIDVGAETGGLNELIVFGVTGLEAGDFSEPDD